MAGGSDSTESGVRLPGGWFSGSPLTGLTCGWTWRWSTGPVCERCWLTSQRTIARRYHSRYGFDHDFVPCQPIGYL